MKIRLLLCLMLCLGQSVAWATRTRVPPFHQESWLIEEWYRDYEAARADCDAFAANLGYPGQCAGFGGGLIHGVPVGVVWGGNFCHYGPNWWECQQPHIWELGRFYYDYPFEKNVGPDCPGPCTPNPINIGNGNKHLREVDFRGGGAPPLEFSRTYNSLAWTEDGSLGAKWLSNYARWLDPLHLGTRLRVRAFRPTGKSFGFQFLNGTYVADADVNDRLTHTTAGDGTITAWQYRVASDDSLETYRPDGKLASIAARNGLMQVLQYGILPTPDGPTAQAELLVRVTDSFGRELSFAYDTAGRLAALTDSLGHHYGYGYDAQGDLVSVSYPDGGTRQYLYNEADYTSGANLPHALTGVIDENGSRFATYRYDSDGRAVSSELAGGVARYALSYPDPVRSSVVTDPLGTQRTYQFQNILGRLSNTSVAQPAGAGSPAATQTTSFDAHGNISARTDFKGTSTTYQHDPVRNLETSRTEAAGTPAARSTSTQWHALYRLPTRISEPVSGGSRVTEFSYDASGNLLTKTITAPNGLGGSETRTWHTTYNGFGQVLSVDGPRGDVADLASYTYYASTDPSGNYRLGDLATSSNALGQTTVYQAYDAAGRLLKTIDPNGLETRLTYTPRGWLASRAVGTAAEGFATTSYTYDAAGQLLTVTLPEGSTLHYQYDPAHRLTEVRDGTGNRLRYTLDALGNRIKEEAFDPQGALARTRSRAFDALARLAQEWGASTAARTVYGYDANGNLTSSTDPLGHLTTRQYDAFNRLIGLTDPLAGQVLYQYSPDHQLTALTDPLARSTTFAHNGFGEVLAEDSPDRGATQYRYLAGQLLSKTDARGEVVQFQYDALNRLSRSTFSDQTQVFTYDACTFGLGRLCRLADAGALTQFAYDRHGRVLAKTQTVEGVSLAVAYGYDAAGQRVSLTTPSGQSITFQYAQQRPVAVAVNGLPLLTAATRAPFGALAGWRWGNDSLQAPHGHMRASDLDGRPALIASEPPGLHQELGWDTAGRLTALTDPGLDQQVTFGYDALDRLTAQSGANLSRAWTYDALGNRLTLTDGSALGLGYRATFDGSNRRVRTEADSGAATRYAYNALGQRVVKDGPAGKVVFVYDEAGHLLGEYDATGRLIQETVWLEDLPVAVLKPKAGSTTSPIEVDLFYVHADHLGTPRVITRPADNQKVWAWPNVDPFGNNLVDENPSGLGAFAYGLRFPGQYFDGETGGHYNYFRDYEPTIGRYVQSDPIGLKGGINAYAYTQANPLKYADSRGLFAELCTRSFYPLFIVPYADHCFLRFNGDDKDSLGFSNSGVGKDPAPTWWPDRKCQPVYGDPNDDCVRRELATCKAADYDLFKNNCCHCAQLALTKCGLSPNKWPNYPINPAPPPGGPAPRPTWPPPRLPAEKQ